MKRLTARVHGRVQGVSFRYYARREARRLGLTGWVRNERDGTVMVVAEGTLENLQRLENYLQQGPPAARVTGVDSEWSPSAEEFAAFDISWL